MLQFRVYALLQDPRVGWYLRRFFRRRSNQAANQASFGLAPLTRQLWYSLLLVINLTPMLMPNTMTMRTNAAPQAKAFQLA